MRVEYTRCTGKRRRHLSAHQHAYTNVTSPPVRRTPSTHAGVYTSPTRARIPVHVWTRRARTSQSMRLLPHACSTHSRESGHPQGHTSIPWYISKRVCTQTRRHRRARTRVFTPRARARTEPPARKASRKALASPPPPPQRPRVGGGGEIPAGRGNQGPTLTRAVIAAPFFPFDPSQPRPLPCKPISQMKVM